MALITHGGGLAIYWDGRKLYWHCGASRGTYGGEYLTIAEARSAANAFVAP